MAQKIATICDRHLETTGEEVPAVSWSVGIAPTIAGDTRPVDIDLCDECAKDLDDVIAMVTAYGRSTKPRKRRHRATSTPDGEVAAHVCPVAGCGRSFPKRQGVSMHVTRMHGAKLTELEAAAGG